MWLYKKSQQRATTIFDIYTHCQSEFGFVYQIIGWLNCGKTFSQKKKNCGKTSDMTREY